MPDLRVHRVLKVVAVLALLLLGLAVPSPLAATTVPAATLVPVLEDLDWPVQLAFAPDGRWFFTERLTGRVRVVEDGVLRPTPWLDLRPEVRLVTDGERGLLGLALHPTFPGLPWVYLFYSYRDGQGLEWNRVARYREVAESAGPSEVILDRIPSAGIHNGGVLGFGPDGMLYVTTGDVAEPGLAQDLESLAGKVLRLRPDGSVPSDNPFPGSPVFTLGHRNVFGLTFRPSDGVPYISENAPFEPEEVNRLLPGGNYAWPLGLGRLNDPRYVDPVAELSHMAPTGLTFYVVGGTVIPTGALLLGNWVHGALLRLQLDAAGETALDVSPLAGVDEGILDVESSPQGVVYVTTPTRILRLDVSGETPPDPPAGTSPWLLVVAAVAVSGGGLGLLLYGLRRGGRKKP